MTLGERVARRFRYGKPIIVVSGLPRSGTSMVMNMLDSGGVPVLTDGIRSADDSNPRGYFEYEPVKELGTGRRSRLGAARPRQGGQDHLVSPHVAAGDVRLPHRLHAARSGRNHRVAEPDAGAPGEPAGAGDASIRDVYAGHLQQMERFLASRRCFRTLPVSYRDVVDDPERQASRVRDFLDRPLDVARMASTVDRQLYRNRR